MSTYEQQTKDDDECYKEVVKLFPHAAMAMRRMRRAADRETGCYLTKQMVRELKFTLLSTGY